MKKVNLKNKFENWKKIGLTALSALVAGLALSVYVAPIVASAEEAAAPQPALVGIDVTIKETQETHQISIFDDEEGLIAACATDDSFQYEVTAEGEEKTVYCEGLSENGDYSYALSYTVFETAEGENNENVLSITKGADVVEVAISLNSSIIYYDAYLEGEGKSDLSATLSDDGKTLTVLPEENKAVAASDVMTVKIIIPDTVLVEDFQDTLTIANDIIIPKIYLVVGVILLIALVIVCFAIFFVAG